MSPSSDTIQRIIEALHIGTSDEDYEVVTALRADPDLGLPTSIPLADALIQVHSDRLVAAILRQAVPFARMLVDIYNFLAQRRSSMEGATSLLVSDSVRGDLEFDLDYFDRVIQPLIEQFEARVDLECLNSTRATEFPDGYWPPVCLDQAAPRPVECAECDGTAIPARFRQVSDGLERVFSQLRERYPLSSGMTRYDWNWVDSLDATPAEKHWLRRMSYWQDDCQPRKPLPNCIGYGHGWSYGWLIATSEDQSVFRGEVRPEILVRRQRNDTTENLVLIECKARHDYGEQDFNKDLSYYYLQVRPKLLMGLNYYRLRPKHGLTMAPIPASNDTLVIVDDLHPGSSDLPRLREIMRRFWPKALGAFVHVLLVDTSGSMSADELSQILPDVKQSIERLPAVDVIFATFADTVTFAQGQPLDEVTAKPMTTGGGTRLGDALVQARDEVVQRFPDVVSVRYYLVTDLQVDSGELEELEQLAGQPRVELSLFARRHWIDETRLARYPELLQRIHWLH